MFPDFQILFVVLVIGGVVFAIVMGVIWEKKRREAIKKFAAELGLEYQEHLSSEDAAEFSDFSLAQKGRSPQGYNVIVADSGELRMVIFDFRFTTGSGKNQSTHHQTVVLSRSSISLRLPQFMVGPESFRHRISDLLGFKDIDFEEDPAFSDAFLLQGENEEAVRGFFNSRRRKELMDYRTMTIEGRGDCFIFYRPRKRAKVDDVRELMQRAFAIYSLLSEEE